MPHLTIHQPANMPNARDFIQLMPLEDEFMLYGFEPNTDFLSVHVTALPEDSRTPAAGLFGICLPESWTAVGTVLSGTATHPEDEDSLSSKARVRLVVTRSGDSCTELSLDGAIVNQQPPSDSNSRHSPEGEHDHVHPTQGMITDCLHRMLGLPSPGAAPSLATLVVGVWLNEVMQSAMSLEEVTWERAVALHPGEPGLGSVSPSLETMTEATFRAADQLDWERMRRRAARGEFQATALRSDEAEWMDAAMFGRWVASSVPDIPAILRTLHRLGADHVAEKISAVLQSVQQARMNAD